MTRIMVFGTFDMIHPGHEDFFRQARALAEDPFLIVSVARDISVFLIKQKNPRNTERERRALLEKHPLVNLAILGDHEGYMEHIVKNEPQIIALGYDQAGKYVDNLERDLAEAEMNVKIARMSAYMPEIYKTSKLHPVRKTED